LIVQIEDVLIQGDPFTTHFTKDELVLVGIGIAVDAIGSERTDLAKLSPKRSLIVGRPFVTQHIFGGGIKAVLVFLDMFLTYYSVTYDEFELVSEYVHFLYTAYTFADRSKRLDLKLIGTAEGFSSLKYSAKENATLRPGKFKKADGRYPSIIYDFVGNEDFRYAYYDSCARGKIKSQHYMAGIPEGYMNGTIDRYGNPVQSDDEWDD
jgi:hypothetical protein